MLRTLLLLALARPATIDVRVDALALPHAQTEQLHGELMTRLVEAGHAVGVPGAVTVRLTGGGDVVHIEVVHGTQVHARDVKGRGAVLRLAVIHAAIELLAEVEAVRVDPDPALAAAPERAVVVQIDDDAQHHAAPAIAAVVEAGFVVTPAAADAKRRVCIGDDGGVATLAVVATDDACAAGATVTTWVVDLAEALRDEPDEPEPAPPPAIVAPAPIMHAPVDAPPPPKSPPPRAWSWALGVGVGAQGRLRHAEPIALVHGDARHLRGAWLTARLAVAPSTEAAIADTFVTVGAGYGGSVTRRLRLEAAIAGGIVVHGYRVAGDRGARVDPTLELPIAAAIALGSRVELVLAMTTGFSARARRHVRDDDVVWSRDRWRVGGTLGVNVMLGRKPSRASSAAGS